MKNSKARVFGAVSAFTRQVLLFFLLLCVDGCGWNYLSLQQNDDVRVSNGYISNYSDYRMLDIPTLTGYCPKGQKFCITDIPKNCRAVMLEGDFDLSNIQTNHFVEYFSDRFCMRSGAVHSILWHLLQLLYILPFWGTCP